MIVRREWIGAWSDGFFVRSDAMLAYFDKKNAIPIVDS
jgi:hypothetical protein